MDFWIELFKPLFAVFLSEQFRVFVHYLYILAPFWLPVALAFGFWNLWVRYVQAKFIADQKYILLELKLPPEVQKSPLAMELVLSGLHQTGGAGTWYKRLIQGKMHTWFSLEIASFEGNVHFYVWTREYFKNLIEAQFYGQYPNIEITEVPDYTDMMPYYDKNCFGLWGCYQVLSKPDPYPIKTYVDYGLDKDPKEEFKIDPMTSVVEYLGLMGKGEYIWIQILFRAHKQKPKGWFGRTTWQDEGREVINKIYENMKREVLKESVKETAFSFPRAPTKAETIILEALERSISKHGFDVGIRTIYFAEGNRYSGARIPGFINIMKPFGAPGFEKKEDRVFGFNSLIPTRLTDFDYPWEDFMQIREMRNRRKIVDAYRRRSYFFAPYYYKPFVLNAEELATIYHPVGTVLQMPSVARVASRKAEPPTNLPR